MSSITMEHLPINDLPNELLEVIFDHLNVEDLKNASLVCKRWLDLAFSGRRMDRVMLAPKFPYDIDFLQSNRKYRHVELGETEKCSAHMKKSFQTCNVCSMRIEYSDIFSHSALRSMLLEVPNLQHLSIYSEPDKMSRRIKPLPVMRKLERLEIYDGHSNSGLPWHTIAPYLQGLKMYCFYEDQLEQWRLFSGQLKQVYATCNDENVLSHFCEMTFPCLEELSLKSGFDSARVHDLFQRHEFFRRNASLRLLRLHGIYLSKTLVSNITKHSKMLTSLEIIGICHAYEGNGGSLESLSLLTELKHLRLENLNANIFLGCGSLTSLQSLCIEDVMIGREFFKDLFKIAPQLRCLELGSTRLTEMDIQFICNNFSKLSRLQLTHWEELSHDCLSGIERLLHLWYLELELRNTNRFFISNIPPNEVRCLTLHLRYQYDLLGMFRLPEMFPQLGRLNLIIRDVCLRESTIDTLRKLLPTCAIITYGYLQPDTGRSKCCREWPTSEMMSCWEKEWVWKTRPFFL